MLFEGPEVCSPPDPNRQSGWPAVSFDNPSYGVTVEARVLNATAIACTPPPVVEGLAALSVSFDNVTWSAPWDVSPDLATPGCKGSVKPGCAGNPCLQCLLWGIHNNIPHDPSNYLFWNVFVTDSFPGVGNLRARRRILRHMEAVQCLRPAAGE